MDTSIHNRCVGVSSVNHILAIVLTPYDLVQAAKRTSRTINDLTTCFQRCVYFLSLILLLSFHNDNRKILAQNVYKYT